MRMLKGTLHALVLITALLVRPSPGFAGGDDTNAANIDLDLWAQMSQVMAGTSAKSPSSLPDGGLDILTPKGIYVIVMMPYLITQAHDAATSLGITTDVALTNYFTVLLNNPAVSGLLLTAPWRTLNPNDPTTSSSPYSWNSLDDAFTAIANWNSSNPTLPPKTLQLVVNPGFNSPSWIFNHLDSCDGLFLNPHPTKLPSSSCGYTNIFLETEGGTPTAKPLPLPWNATYKSLWRTFLIALNAHIASNPNFVSIGVGGPTASSEEMILPNTINNPGSSLTLPNPPSGHSTASNISALSAWNCLLANNYGPTSPYLNSNRAFVEEWNAAIDMYGGIFSGITLTVSTGDGLPFSDVPAATSPPVPGCALSGISLPTSPSLSAPPPGFAPDCGTSLPMDCAAETAVLAYFAEPPVGGPNAKATQMDGLTAAGLNNFGNLSTASVKWLSAFTIQGLVPLPDNTAVSARMLGGSQFGKSFSSPQNMAVEDCPMGTRLGTCALSSTPPVPGCVVGTVHSTTCVAMPSPEQALFNILQVYFAGTMPGGSYYGEATGYNSSSASFTGAPIDYLQIYWQDILYAEGLTGCSYTALMSAPANTSGCAVSMASHTTLVNGKLVTAQDLLNTASGYIPTRPVTLPLFGYSFPTPPGPWLCRCNSGYGLRQAFQGDDVCVDPAQQAQAVSDNKAATIKSRYKINASDLGISYGTCIKGYVWRQAYMGDYVCVTRATQKQVAADNAARRYQCTRLGPVPPPH
jgi:hypothetical protein